MSYLQQFNPAKTPQTEQASSLQVENSAGGYSFQVDCFKRLERFLILGAEGGSYYAGERKLVTENCKALLECAKLDHVRTVKMIVDVSRDGRAPKNDEAIFCLAQLAACDIPAARTAALEVLPDVCRIGTHLFQFVEFVNAQRGWGRGLRRSVAKWYTSKSQEDLAFQIAKYSQRNGWSHADVLSLCHGSEMSLNPVLRYAAAGPDGGGDREIYNNHTGKLREYPAVSGLPPILEHLQELKNCNEGRTIQLITDYGFTHEMIGTEHKNSPQVWEALLQRMPPGAMLRNLGKMTQVGLLQPLSAAVLKVQETLTDPKRLRSARLHPIQILNAFLIYARGHGDKGSLSWTPVSAITAALDTGFYEAFSAIEPSNKRFLLAFDVSGSMDGSHCSGLPLVSARVAAATMGMVTARAEKQWHAIAFTSNGWRAGGDSRWGPSYPATVSELAITPRMQTDEVVRTMQRLPMGGTDCSLPMIYAKANKIPVDTFVVYTDNETWAGSIHPFQALREYRQATGIPARLAVVSMVANNFTIADPNDAGMLNCVGFSSDTPSILSSFSNGSL